MSPEPQLDAPWPTYPSVTMGAGKWRDVIRFLRSDGRAGAAKMADRIEREVREDAARIARQAAARAAKGG